MVRRSVLHEFAAPSLIQRIQLASVSHNSPWHVFAIVRH
jgi:hypothetical protein